MSRLDIQHYLLSSVGKYRYRGLYGNTNLRFPSKFLEAYQSFNFAEYLWTDGEHLYLSYAYSDYYYKYNTDAHTWESMSWNIAPMYGYNVWTDGTNIYYSDGSQQYVLNKAEETWETKTWVNQPSYLNGRYIWTDGTNIYYSDGGSSYKLDKDTATWTEISWLHLFYGMDVWTDGIYTYCNGSHVFNGTDWESVTFNGLEGNFSGRYIWTDGTNVYYSPEASARGKAYKHYVLHAASRTWIPKTFGIETVPNLYGRYIWSDCLGLYYSYGDTQMQFNESTKIWEPKLWETLTTFNGDDIWTDGTLMYHSNGETHSLLGNNWVSKGDTWPSLIGKNIWTLGDDIYYSNGTTQLVLNKTSGLWEEKVWEGLTDFEGLYVWHSASYTYYSNYNVHYRLDTTTGTWSTVSFGSTRFYGYNVWTDGTNYYMSPGGQTSHGGDVATYRLYDSDTPSWSYIYNSIAASGQDIWKYKGQIYHSQNDRQYTYKGTTFGWNLGSIGYAIDWFSYASIWCDGFYIYCSSYTKTVKLVPDGTIYQYLGGKWYIVKKDEFEHPAGITDGAVTFKDTLDFSAMPNFWLGYTHYVLFRTDDTNYIALLIGTDSVKALNQTTLEWTTIYSNGTWAKEAYKNMYFPELLSKTAITLALYNWIEANKK